MNLLTTPMPMSSVCCLLNLGLWENQILTAIINQSLAWEPKFGTPWWQGETFQLDYLNKISNGRIKPGDVINGQPVNGSILGTRSFSVDSGNNLEDLSLEIDRLTAIVGSEVTFENNAELDVSTLDSTGDNQVVAFAAAKDLVIKGNLTFKNSKNSKQAISIGAADDVHLRSKSITDYFDNEFAQKYLNEIDDPIFLGSDPIKPRPLTFAHKNNQ